MSCRYSIHNLPAEERPRERLMRHGPEAMATSELIAVILGSGMKGMSVLQLAQEIVARFGSVKQLAEATVEELCTIKGLGHAKAIQLKAALSLGMRVSQNQAGARYRIEGPVHAYNLVKDDLERAKQEHFVLILLDTKGYVIRHEVVGIGTLSNTLVHPREVFYPAVRHKAASVVLVHNHPSGDPTPSDEDKNVTENLIEIGKMMSIPVHDHLIIGKGTFVSFRQQGICF